MKRVSTMALLLILIIGRIEAVDTGSYQFIEHIITLSSPRAPEFFEDGIIFTASASHRRAGVAFAHEGFSKVYWFQRVLVPKDLGPPGEASRRTRPVEYEETGILFYVYTPPEGLRELAYRLIIDGLWSTDPLNPRERQLPGGSSQSLIPLPPRPPAPGPSTDTPGILSLRYSAAPGEQITVAGDFNGWDPFMYELREISPGYYTLNLPLPPGNYRYVFFHRGERIADPNNPRRVYTKEGKAVSEAQVK